MCARAVLTNCMHLLISKSACRKSLKQFDSSNWYYLSLFRRWLKKFGQGMEQITIRHPTTPSDRPYSVKENAICLQLPLVSVFRIENVRPSSNIFPSPYNLPKHRRYGLKINLYYKNRVQWSVLRMHTTQILLKARIRQLWTYDKSKKDLYC